MLAKVLCFFAYVTIAVCDDSQKNGPEVVRKHGYAKRYGYRYSPRYGLGLGHGYGLGHGHLHEHGYGPRYGSEYGPGYGHGHGYRYRHGYGHREVDYYAFPRYKFGYKVVDHPTSDIKEQQEHRHGDVVRGYYELHQPDGAERIVRYYANDHVGYQADV